MRIIEIFDSLQGEGVWTGTPMTFVRLAGCNAPEEALDCVRWCDTPAFLGPRRRPGDHREGSGRAGAPAARLHHRR